MDSPAEKSLWVFVPGKLLVGFRNPVSYQKSLKEVMISMSAHSRLIVCLASICAMVILSPNIKCVFTGNTTEDFDYNLCNNTVWYNWPKFGNKWKTHQEWTICPGLKSLLGKELPQLAMSQHTSVTLHWLGSNMASIIHQRYLSDKKQPNKIMNKKQQQKTRWS